jgi:putative transposase
MVDTLGLILALVVHPANIQDRNGARKVIKKLKGSCPRGKKIWADGGYRGKLVDWVKSLGRGWVLEIVQRSADTVGFAVLPKRWIVERTLAWLGRYRRLSKDYETLPESSETMIYLAMINLMIHRLVWG